jgi:hypothetical protein
MRSKLNKGLLAVTLIAALFLGGCISCIPQYAAPSMPPPSACYPGGHDPYMPTDHNAAMLNPWDALKSLFSPFLYGPPR